MHPARDNTVRLDILREPVDTKGRLLDSVWRVYGHHGRVCPAHGALDLDGEADEDRHGEICRGESVSKDLSVSICQGRGGWFTGTGSDGFG